MRRALTTTAVAIATALAVAACGDDEDAPAASGGRDAQPVVVSAAASLQTAFEDYARSLDPAPRFSFAGSDELAAQIRQGVKPDVFASANTTLPDELYDEGLVERPEVFAGNRLVLAVPAGDDAIGSLADAGGSGVALAVGSASVPIGAYTRKVLDGLPAAARDRILANVRSEEPDVKGIVGKLTQGAVDGGFVYVTDVAAAQGELDAIELPDSLQPSVAYGVAVVKGAEHPEEAQAFVDGLVGGTGQEALRAAGFEPPPR
jgi:molybdate transport system substrate-binding protein